MSDWTRRELRSVARDVLPANKRVITRHLKDAAPVDTGALRRSISTRGGARGAAEVRMLSYGEAQDAKGPHAGWIGRGLDEAVDEINGR